MHLISVINTRSWQFSLMPDRETEIRGVSESERIKMLMESKEEQNSPITLQHFFKEYATNLGANTIHVVLILSNCHSKVVMIRKVIKLNLG